VAGAFVRSRAPSAAQRPDEQERPDRWWRHRQRDTEAKRMDFNQQKQLLLDALLPLCPFVAVDATREGVSVPESLKRPDLVLRVGRDPRVMGMPDLTIDEKGWRATISLQGVRHYVVVPWEACLRFWVGEPYAGPMVVWPELAQKPKPPAPSGPSLRVVKGGG
jgi:hypothetical protein